ncbi:MAG TPA: DUF2264 domain-containing protein [Chitinophagaceae bacterium]|nr:DUF2264 domain-containing protein [Chitinophagaceae bacterium]
MQRSIKCGLFLFLATTLFLQGNSQKTKQSQSVAKESTPTNGMQDRSYWCDVLYKIASPVVFNLAEGTLKKNMTVEKAPGYGLAAEKVTYLEAVGRTMAGIAPWLALPDDETAEGHQRKKLRLAMLKGIANAVNPAHEDYLNFRTEQQPLVDAAFMAQGFLRAPQALWEPLDSETKKRVIEEFKSLRTRSAAYNNWLLFAAISETFLMSVGQQADPARIDFALKKMEEWYAGDGWYNDGPHFNMDYYNSFVIQPMLVDLYSVLLRFKKVSEADYEKVVKRLVRNAEFQERLISADGSFPPFGRSITYRTGAFQVLAQTALLNRYPEQIPPAQIRCAMTALMKRMYDGCNNFDAKGWLVLGFCGSQPTIADYYTSTGSLYMATLSFLPLGLPADHDFWTGAPTNWTQKKAWNSEPFKKDYKVDY